MQEARLDLVHLGMNTLHANTHAQLALPEISSQSRLPSGSASLLPGICQCGCGLPTTRIVYDSKNSTGVRGEYRKFVHTHHWRLKRHDSDARSSYEIAVENGYRVRGATVTQETQLLRASTSERIYSDRVNREQSLCQQAGIKYFYIWSKSTSADFKRSCIEHLALLRNLRLREREKRAVLMAQFKKARVQSLDTVFHDGKRSWHDIIASESLSPLEELIAKEEMELFG